MKKLFLLIFFPLSLWAAPNPVAIRQQILTTNPVPLGANGLYLALSNGFPVWSNVIATATGTVSLASITNIVSGALTNGNMLYVDKVVGSDTLGRRWNFAWPFLTPLAAKNAAVAGDTIQVRPGGYTNNALLKNGVNWHFLPGSWVAWRPLADNATNAYAIFDDRVTGACTSNIAGEGRFYYTGSIDDISVATGTKGFMYVQNASSSINFNGEEVQCTEPTGTAGQAAFWIENCNVVHIHCNDIYDPNTNGLSNVIGVYWEKGNVFANVPRNRSTLNAVYGSDPTTNTTAYSMYYSGEYAETTTGDNATVYILGNATNKNYRLWVECKEIVSTIGPSIAYVTGGKLYVNCQVARSLGGASPGIYGNGAADAWLTIQKTASASNACLALGPVVAYSGKTVAQIAEFEDGGHMPSFIDMMSGQLVMKGGSYCKGTNASVRGLVQSGGTCRVDQITFDLSAATKTTNHPIHMAGGTLILDRATLVAPTTTTNSIFAPSAQTVKVGHVSANTNYHPNVTIAGDIFSVSGSVQ